MRQFRLLCLAALAVAICVPSPSRALVHSCTKNSDCTQLSDTSAWCVGGQCQYELKECTPGTEKQKCDDGNSSTTDYCDPMNFVCYNFAYGKTCSKDSECPSSNPLLQGKCWLNRCAYYKACKTAEECNDGRSDTSDYCFGYDAKTCGHSYAACKSDADCTKAVVLPYETASCVSGQCKFKASSCAKDIHCNDGNLLTVDTCSMDAGAKSGFCQNKLPGEDTIWILKSCKTDGECTDNSYCRAGQCAGCDKTSYGDNICCNGEPAISRNTSWDCGATCVKSEDCSYGQNCTGGKCLSCNPGTVDGICCQGESMSSADCQCSRTSDCGAGKYCVNSRCLPCQPVNTGDGVCCGGEAPSGADCKKGRPCHQDPHCETGQYCSAPYVHYNIIYGVCTGCDPKAQSDGICCMGEDKKSSDCARGIGGCSSQKDCDQLVPMYCNHGKAQCEWCNRYNENDGICCPRESPSGKDCSGSATCSAFNDCKTGTYCNGRVCASCNAANTADNICCVGEDKKSNDCGGTTCSTNSGYGSGIYCDFSVNKYMPCDNKNESDGICCGFEKQSSYDCRDYYTKCVSNSQCRTNFSCQKGSWGDYCLACNPKTYGDSVCCNGEASTSIDCGGTVGCKYDSECKTGHTCAGGVCKACSTSTDGDGVCCTGEATYHKDCDALNCGAVTSSVAACWGKIGCGFYYSGSRCAMCNPSELNDGICCRGLMEHLFPGSTDCCNTTSNCLTGKFCYQNTCRACNATKDNDGICCKGEPLSNKDCGGRPVCSKTDACVYNTYCSGGYCIPCDNTNHKDKICCRGEDMQSLDCSSASTPVEEDTTGKTPCSADSDCVSGKLLVAGRCVDFGPPGKFCLFEDVQLIPDRPEDVAPPCKTDADCDDSSPQTADVCMDPGGLGFCRHLVIDRLFADPSLQCSDDLQCHEFGGLCLGGQCTACNSMDTTDGMCCRGEDPETADCLAAGGKDSTQESPPCDPGLIQDGICCGPERENPESTDCEREPSPDCDPRQHRDDRCCPNEDPDSPDCGGPRGPESGEQPPCDPQNLGDGICCDGEANNADSADCQREPLPDCNPHQHTDGLCCGGENPDSPDCRDRQNPDTGEQPPCDPHIRGDGICCAGEAGNNDSPDCGAEPEPPCDPAEDGDGKCCPGENEMHTDCGGAEQDPRCNPEDPEDGVCCPGEPENSRDCGGSGPEPPCEPAEDGDGMCCPGESPDHSDCGGPPIDEPQPDEPQPGDEQPGDEQPGDEQPGDPPYGEPGTFDNPGPQCDPGDMQDGICCPGEDVGGDCG